MSTPHVPVSPGDHDRPDWWTEQDDAILRGELAKLADLPRPAGLPQRTPAVPAYVPPRPSRAREIGALVIVVAAMIGLLLFAFAPDPGPAPAPCASVEPGGCVDVVEPTTYGPPGPAGGAFTSMPVR